MEINSVAWNPATEYILATGSADCVSFMYIYLFIDLKLLKNNYIYIIFFLNLNFFFYIII